MFLTRRAFILLAVLSLIAVAGGALRIACVGRSCEEISEATTRAPFCKLPAPLRERLSAGFREGSSPDVLAVTDGASVIGGTAFKGRSAPPWPSSDAPRVRVPLVFWGTGVAPGASIPEGTTLDSVAPTVAEMMGLRRPHPEVRSGRALAGVAVGERPRLMVVVVLHGIGAEELENSQEDWPGLQKLIDEGAATMAATPGSEPSDPAAVETTIGTGGLPRQHGITGTLLRNSENGRLVRAWSADAPVSVIAGLGDDLDELTNNDAEIGLVAPHISDRGLIGGSWYVTGRDDDVLAIGTVDAHAAAASVLEQGFGSDDISDLLGVALTGPPARLDSDLSEIVEAAEAAADGSVAVVVTATGASERSSSGLAASSLASKLAAEIGSSPDIVEAVGVGGLFLDQAILAEERIPERDVVRALVDVRSADGDRVFVDAFPAIAVSLGRYC